jgi:hypothetical protein
MPGRVPQNGGWEARMAKGQTKTDTKLSQVAKRTITLARKIHAYYDDQLPKWYRHYPVISPGEEGPPPPSEEKALTQLLSELPPDLLYQLLLVMYLGRGDFEVENLAEAYAPLKQSLGEPKWAASEMLEKASLADYLSDGLVLLQEHGIDVDHLPLQTGGVAKS